MQNHRRRPAEGRLAAKHLVQDDPQTILVARRTGFAQGAVNPFRGHVRRRANERPVLGQLLLALSKLGEAEVHQQGLLAHVEHDVGRFHVPVNDSQFVGMSEGVGQVADHARRFARRQPLLRETGRQRSPFNQRRGNIAISSFIPGVVDGYEVRVLQSRRRLRLTEESPARFGVLQRGRTEHLERYLPPEHRVVGAIHRSGRANTETLLDLEAGQLPRLVAPHDLLIHGKVLTAQRSNSQERSLCSRRHASM